MNINNTHFQAFMGAFASHDESFRLLDGDHILCPPSEDFGYPSTPENALTFASVGVDGVHYSILKIGGVVRDDSPVVQVSPMDAKDVIVLAASFLSYLADGCGVSTQDMQSVFDTKHAGKHALVSFLSAHFDTLRLFEEDRIQELTARYGHLIERKRVSG